MLIIEAKYLASDLSYLSFYLCVVYSYLFGMLNGNQVKLKVTKVFTECMAGA